MLLLIQGNSSVILYRAYTFIPVDPVVITASAKNHWQRLVQSADIPGNTSNSLGQSAKCSTTSRYSQWAFVFTCTASVHFFLHCPTASCILYAPASAPCRKGTNSLAKEAWATNGQQHPFTVYQTTVKSLNSWCCASLCKHLICKLHNPKKVWQKAESLEQWPETVKWNGMLENYEGK